MEKKVICLLAFLFTTFVIYAAGDAPVPVTPLPDNVTKTAAIEEDMFMEVRLKELFFNITPEFQFVLPDASLKIGIKQKVGDTMLDASTEYNYLYNKIRYDIRYSVDVYLTFSANLYDAVSFEQVYQNQKYIQRNKGFGLSIQSPEIFDFLIFREEFRVDNYYFARLDNAYSPDTGYIMILNSWLELDLSFSNKGIKPTDRFAVNFDKSIPSEFSSYNFLFLEIYADKKFNFEGGQSLSLKFEGGYLLEKNDAPIWQIYRLGGYDRMMGYNYDEFEGYYMDFMRIRYETPVLEKVNWEFFWIKLDTVRMFTIFDMGSAGGDHEVVNIDHYNYSAGLGLIIEFTFRGRTPVKMTFAMAQAIKQGKTPVFYFVHEF
jgi:hypothetical protein